MLLFVRDKTPSSPCRLSSLIAQVYPTDPDGFTFNTFEPNTTSRVTGDPLLCE